jgi:hypothetical protein
MISKEEQEAYRVGFGQGEASANAHHAYEIEYLKSVITQAVEFAGISINEHKVMCHSLVPVSVFPDEGGFPHLYDYVLRGKLKV